MTDLEAALDQAGLAGAIELEDGAGPELRQIEQGFLRSLVGAVGARTQADALVGVGRRTFCVAPLWRL